MASLEEDLATAQETIGKRDADLAKAKRMLVALNNKFKAKFAKLEEKAKAQAEARGAAGDGGADPEQLAARDKEIESLQTQLAAAKANSEVVYGHLVTARENLAAATAASAKSEEEEEGGQLAELRSENEELHEALGERDGIIAMAKEKFKTVSSKVYSQTSNPKL